MKVWPVRLGTEFSIESSAFAGMIRAASVTAEFGSDDSTAFAIVSTPNTVDAEFGIDMVGAGYPYPTLIDPIGTIEFEFSLDPSWNGSFVNAQEFDSGRGSGSGGPSISDGFQVPLGDIEAAEGGSWLPGAVDLTDETAVSSAINLVNKVLSLLIPNKPPAFPNGTLSVANAAGGAANLCSGVADATGGTSGWAAGSAVTRIAATGVSSYSFSDVGPGNAGTLALLVNGAVVGERELTGTDDEGNYGGLVLSDQKDFPVLTPGFWKSLDVTITNAAALLGINNFRITHSAAGSTATVPFVRDGLTTAPTITLPSMVETTQGTLAYSSGVPHYGDGATMTVSASMNNLSGETYYGGSDVFVVSSAGGVIATQNFGYAALGITTPLARQTVAAAALNEVVVAINGSGHVSGQLRALGKNVNGAGANVNLSSATLLVKRGAAGAKIDELSVAVSGLGSAPVNTPAIRKGLGAGDTPVGSGAAWVQSAAPAAHEATVVAGVLKHDRTNYATGYYPVGPDLSVGRDGAQYATFSFRRSAVSAFKITVAGAYAGCRIKLPGVSDQAGIAPNAPNGWWDASKPYDGAGVPGEAGDTVAGCAVGTVMGGASGTFQITFGTESSTNATANEILVRFRLNAGQTITALSFSN